MCIIDPVPEAKRKRRRAYFRNETAEQVMAWLKHLVKRLELKPERDPNDHTH